MRQPNTQGGGFDFDRTKMGFTVHETEQHKKADLASSKTDINLLQVKDGDDERKTDSERGTLKAKRQILDDDAARRTERAGGGQ